MTKIRPSQEILNEALYLLRARARLSETLMTRSRLGGIVSAISKRDEATFDRIDIGLKNFGDRYDFKGLLPNFHFDP